MSGPLLRFEDGKISIGNKDLLAKSASLSYAPSLNEEKVYGDYDEDLAGAKTEFVKFAPTSGLRGKLNVSFYISPEEFAEDGNPNTINRMFEIIDGMSDEPINNNLIGRYRFDNMYLTSFSFDLKPFAPVMATASYDIYGSLKKSYSLRFNKTESNFAHGLKSFASIYSSGSSKEDFEISSLSYRIIVNRKVANRIRANESTSLWTTADGTVPFRVSTESIQKEMTIEISEMIENLNVYGDQQNVSSPENLSDSKIEAFLFSINDDRIARFSVEGKIQQQSMNISEGSYAKGSVSIKEIIK